MTLPSRDSGVFLYIGWRLIKGDIPYRDVWDHKPPLIYFVDAIGLLITPQSMTGVWLLQFCFLFLTIFFLFNSMKESLGTVPAIAGTVVLISGLLTILDRGNVTEEYALVFQTLGIGLFLKARKDDYPFHSMFWIGLCGAFAFYFKQTTIGFLVTLAFVFVCIRINQKKSPVKDLLALFIGFGLLSIFLGLLFLSWNALSDFWSEAFLYNFIYIGKHEGIRRLIPVFIKGFSFLSQGSVLYLSLAGWLTGLLCVIKKTTSLDNARPLIIFALINFPIEVVFITISGRSILHYYLTPLPVMAVLSAILVYGLGVMVGNIFSSSTSRLNRVVSGAVLLAVLLFQIGQIYDYPADIESAAENNYSPVVDFVTSHTNPSDKVLVIGAESSVNFLSRREAPTRYVYQYPLQLLGSRVMFEEYFQQILRNKPVLIIDAPGSNQLDQNLYKPLQLRSQKVREGVEYLLQNYQPAATFGEWVVYEVKESP